MSPDEYLAFEREAECKHEYWHGEVFAMAGASREHNLLVSNLVHLLVGALQDRPCEVYPSDMRVSAASAKVFTYPDVSVVCSGPNFADDAQDTLLNPVVIIEVLSDSTEAYDRGKKFEYYRTIPSLQHYLLVAQSQPLECSSCDRPAAWPSMSCSRDCSSRIPRTTRSQRWPTPALGRASTFNA
jgi:Uma2 family endonuclease